MKIEDLEQESTGTMVSFAGVIEKLEILRSTFRWASKLERSQIEKLLTQCNSVRDEVLQLSHKERFVKASGKTEPEKRSRAERRKGLLEREFQFDGVFGDNLRLLESLEISEKAARTDLPVLIGGESGTGKELMAKVIHANSTRADRALISVNCGALPENLVESELFGHKKGAFTGASSDRKGKFESADNGTIFLDEIGELPLQAQVKLLRVLQSHEIQRVGSDEAIRIDARIVAATNRNLLEMVEQGHFREDLYYRLSVIEVTVPSLRERADEIQLLIEFFSEQAAEEMGRDAIRLSSRLNTHLMRYNYPGNIRELRNIIYRLSCLADDVADIEHLPENARPQSHAGPATPAEISTSIAGQSLSDIKKAASDDAERLFLEQGLREVDGKVVELARRINLNRSHLQTLLKKHGIKSKSFRQAKS